MRLLLGPLPFWVTFGLIEVWKMLLVFLVGAGNFSAFVQTAIILEFRLAVILKLQNNKIDLL